MSCAFDNRTPLPALLVPHLSAEGRAQQLLVVKATWRLDSATLAPVEAQQPIRKQPDMRTVRELDLDDVQRRCLGPLQDREITWLDIENHPPKPAFDLIVAGYATAPAGFGQAFIDAQVQVGGRSATLRAHAPRCWFPGFFGSKPHVLRPAVRRVPVNCAFADWASGLLAGAQAQDLDLMPWLEAPSHPSKRGRHARVVAGFGPWPANAAHRHVHAGTYDDRWKAERAPALPTDFNPRYWNHAHPDLQFSTPPAPGSSIRLQHLGERGVVDTRMPQLPLSVQARRAGGTCEPARVLAPDTLVIEPDENRMCLLWRLALDDGDGPDTLTTVQLDKTRQAAFA